MKKSGFKAMLATISLLGIVPVSVNSLINHSIVPYAKTVLNDVIKVRDIKGEDANDIDSVLAQLLIVNSDLIISDVEITNFSKASEIAPGAAIVSAKADTNYIGVVGITIAPLLKIDLNTVITAKELKGQNANNPEMVLRELKNVNPRLIIEDIEIKDFNAPTEIVTGSARIVAKEDTKYTGEVFITINVLPKINLNDVIRIREVDGAVVNDESSVLKEIARINSDLDINDVEIGDFKSASESAPGLATVIAKENTKYIDEVSIIINPLPKTALSSIITERTVNGTDANEAETVLKVIAELNSDLDINDVEIRYFNKATDITPGSVVISAKTNSKYTGQVGVTIKPLTDLFLNKNDNNEQQIITAINSTKFSKSVSLNSSAVEVVASVNAKYMKDRLDEEFSKLFNDSLFKVNKLINDKGETLSDKDLIFIGTTVVTVNYDYGSIKEQNLKLIFTVEQIARTRTRDKLLSQIKVKTDKNEDDNEWSEIWFNYFKQLETDINLFDFKFPEENLNQKRILKDIVYDEIELVMESDFKYWNIEKGYDPDSVVVIYSAFNIDDIHQELSAKGRVSIDVKAYGSYVKHSVRFDYKFGFNII